MLQLILVCLSNPCHPSLIHRLKQFTKCMAGPEFHAHHLPNVHAEGDLVKEFCEDFKQPLQPLRPGICDEPVIRVELRRHFLYHIAKSFFARLHRRNHHHLVSDYGVQNHVEYCGGHRVSLVHPTVALTSGGIVAPVYHHHMYPALVCTKNKEHPGDNAVSIQDV